MRDGTRSVQRTESLVTRAKRAARVLLQDPPAVELVPAITPAEIEEVKAFFPRDKFFIFGHPRSGTTLLARLVRLHPDVYCGWQAHFFTRSPLLSSLVSDPSIREWLSRPSNRWNRGGDLSPLVLRAVADFVLEREAVAHSARIVGDKSPNALTGGAAVQNVAQIHPDCRLIAIVRDPRDTIVSHRFQAFLDAPQTLTREDLSIREEFRNDPAPFLAKEKSIFTEQGLREACQRWEENVRETHRLGTDNYRERFLQVRFEDLLAGPVEAMKQVWSFLEANNVSSALESSIHDEIGSNPDADWQQEKDKSIAKWLPKGQPGSWKKFFTERDQQIVHEVAGDELLKLDYIGAQ